MSDMIKDLIAAQKAMEPARKTANNPHFKSRYADLSAVTDAVLPALNANNFALMFFNEHDETGDYVSTVFAHVSGERVQTRVRLIVAKNDMQGYGSAQTYARRYGLMALAGIAPEDDDGNAAAKAPPPPKTALQQAREDAVADGMAKNDQAKRTMNKARGEAILAEIASFETVSELEEYHKTLEKHESEHPKIAEAVELKLDFLTLQGAE